MIIIIITGIINGHNLFTLIGHVVVDIRDNIADCHVPGGCLHIINTVVVPVSVVNSVNNAAKYITIVIVNQQNLNVMVIFGRYHYGLRVEMRVILVGDKVYGMKGGIGWEMKIEFLQ